MVLVKEAFKMFIIQETELTQLMHEQESPNWFKHQSQQPIFELAFKSYFLIALAFSIVATAFAPVILWLINP